MCENQRLVNGAPEVWARLALVKTCTWFAVQGAECDVRDKWENPKGDLG